MMHRPHRSLARIAPTRSNSGVKTLALRLLLAGALPIVVGCASDTGSSTATPAATPAASADQGRYVIGFDAAHDLGYRVDWQYPSFGHAITKFVVTGDSVFTIDERNFVTRLRREEGDRLWRVPVGSPTDRFIGITYVQEAERVYLNAGTDVFVLDAATGTQLNRGRMERVANTQPLRRGDFLIVGTRDGQLIWYSYKLDTLVRGYEISQSIQVDPVLEGRYIVVVGNDGRIMSLRADSATQVWSKWALAPIVARPVAGNGAVYVASLDQHLRAYELGEARSPLWEYLTESQLTQSPVLIDDHVYQHVPTEGLVCLEALPLDSPGGVLVWRAPHARGNVLTRVADNLIAWDDAGKNLEVVDARFGSVIRTLGMPQIDQIMAADVNRGEIYATDAEGRIVRLVPRVAGP